VPLGEARLGHISISRSSAAIMPTAEEKAIAALASGRRRGSHSGTDGSQTLRWRELNSNFRFRAR
jgi:hypothetical protein